MQTTGFSMRGTVRRRRHWANGRWRRYTQSEAFGINDSSWIVGTLNGEAAIWTPQTGIQAVGLLGTGNQSELEGISNGSVAVGGSTTVGGSDANAIIWDPTNGLRNLNGLIVNPPTTWTPTAAIAISPTGGFIAGIGYSNISTSPPSGTEHAFVLNDGSLTEIPDPGVKIQPEQIDTRGEAAGFYFDANQRQHAFVYTPALGTADIGTLGLSASGGYTPYTEAFGINDSAVVCGSEGLADGSEYGFLWTQAAGMAEVEAPVGIVLDGIEGISDNGDLIGQGYYSNDPALGYRGFLLTPTPEPSTIVLLSVSAATILMARFRRTRGKSFVRCRTENPVGGHWGREMNRLGTISILLATLVWTATSAAQAQMYATAGNQQYSVTDIGVLSAQHPYSTVGGINSSGQVVGQSLLSDGVHGGGYYYPGNGAPLVNVGNLGGAYVNSQALAVNSSSPVVGQSYTDPGSTQGFVWTPQTGMQGVGFLPGGTDSELQSVSDTNVAVGYATPSGASVRRTPQSGTRPTGCETSTV